MTETTLPKLTDEQRSEAGHRAVEARKARADIKAALKSSATDLPDVLDHPNPDIQKMRVSELLTALPKIGPTKAEEIMTDLRIAPSRRVRGLGSKQRHALLERFGYTD